MASTAAVLNILVNANTGSAVGQLAVLDKKLKGTAATANLTSNSIAASFGKKAKLAGGVGALAVTVAVVGKELFKLGNEFDKAYDKIRAGTGATGKELKSLENDFRKVYSKVPSSMDDVGTAVADLNVRLGLSHKPLQRMAVQMTNLSRITDTDLKANIKAVSRAFVDAEVPMRKQNAALDGLYRLSQKSGASVEELATAAQKFGSPLRTLGFSFAETTSMFANFERAGVNAQTMVPGFKLAIGNLISPTDDLKVSLQKLGVAVGDPKRGIKQVMELLGSESTLKSMDKVNLAMQVFGKRAGADMAEAIKQGRFNLKAYIDEFRNGQDTINKAAKATNDTAENFTILGHRIQVALEPAGTAIKNFVDAVSVQLLKIDFEKMTSWLGDVANMTFDATGLSSVAKGIGMITDALGGGKEDVSRLQATSKARMEAVANLQRAVAISNDARSRATGATKAEQAAERSLRIARKRFGDGSAEVLRAEIRLHRAKRRTIKLTEAAKQAERLEGIERKVVASRTRDQVVQEKVKISTLNRSIKQLGRKRQLEIDNNGHTKKSRAIENSIIEKIRIREKTQKRLNNVLGDASRQIGPKFAKSLASISAKSAAMEKALGRLPSPAGRVRKALGQLPGPIKKVGDVSKPSMKKAQDALGDYAAAVVRKKLGVNKNMKTMPVVQAAATQAMWDDFVKRSSALDNGGTPQSKRAGGLIEKVRQKFGKGGVPVAVSPGEMFKTPGGKMGVVPGRPEPRDSVLTSMQPGTKVFTFDGQRRLAEGASESAALRDQLPHFAGGGIVKPEITGGSTKARGLGNKAVDKIHGLATSKLKKLREAAAAAPSGGSWSGGSGQYPGVSGDTDFIPALGNALSKMSKSVGQSISVTSGWRSYAEQAALYAAYLNGTGNLAAPPGSSNHEDGRAADISPGSEVFGSAASRFGMGFTVPGESWHIELLRKGGIAGLVQRMMEGGVLKGRVSYFGGQNTAGGKIADNDAGLALNLQPGTDSGWNNNKTQKWMRASLAGRPYYADVGVEGHSAILPIIDLGPAGWVNRAIDVTTPGVGKLGFSPASSFPTDAIGEAWLLGQTPKPRKGSPSDGEGGFDAGPTPAEKRAAARKSRIEKRTDTIGKLRKAVKDAKTPKGRQSALWELISGWAKYGDFDKKTRKHTVEQVRKAANTVSPTGNISRLQNLAGYLKKNVKVSGAKDENENFVERLKKVQGKGETKATKKRNKILSRIADKGMNYPFKGALKTNTNLLTRYAEELDIAERFASRDDPANGGSDYTDAEIAKLVYWNENILDVQKSRRSQLKGSIKYLRNFQQNVSQLISGKYRDGTYDPVHGSVAPPAGSWVAKWKIPAYKKALKKAKETIGSTYGGDGDTLLGNLAELVGVTGNSGAMLDTRERLAQLRGTTSVEAQAAADKDSEIASLLREQLGLANRNNAILSAQAPIFQQFMPKYHTGGVIPGRTEQPVMAMGGEGIFTRDQMAAMGGGGQPTVVIEIAPGAGVDPAMIDARINGQLVKSVRKVRTGNTGAPKYRTAGLR
jgi:TP901 family phage tail tape measure protein